MLVGIPVAWILRLMLPQQKFSLVSKKRSLEVSLHCRWQFIFCSNRFFPTWIDYWWLFKLFILLQNLVSVSGWKNIHNYRIIFSCSYIVTKFYYINQVYLETFKCDKTLSWCFHDNQFLTAFFTFLSHFFNPRWRSKFLTPFHVRS